MKEKVFLVRTTQTETSEYYVRAQSEEEAREIVLKEQKEENPTVFGERIKTGCFKLSNFKIIDCREMEPEDLVKALFLDDC